MNDPPDRSDDGDSRISRTERGVLIALLAVQAALRVLGAFHHQIDSDEPQHIHVAWAWVVGLLPYRDVFDNHSPLFSLIMAPWLALAGVRPDIVVFMRLAMIPLAIAALVATWWIGRSLFSSRVALWAVAIAGVSPVFMQASVEYRTDQLWMAAWLMSLAVLVSGPLIPRRAFLTGLLFGIDVATSMKTTLLLTALLVSTIATTVLWLRRGLPLSARRIAKCAALALLGLALVPGAFAVYFAVRGAWTPLVYGVIWHNFVPGLGLWATQPLRPLKLLVVAPLLWFLAGALLRRASDPGHGARQALLLLTTGLAYAGIESFWPLVVRSDVLPIIPVASIFATALLLELPEFVRRRMPRARGLAQALTWAPVLVVLVQTPLAAGIISAWRDETGPHVTLMKHILRLTRPDEPVMDLKGESVFRRRPYYLGIETITEERFRMGLIRDDIPEHLISSRTPVVVQLYAATYPPRTRAFIETNYLPIGWMRILGIMLDPPAGNPDGPRAFRLEVPQRYALITESAPARGLLDGAPCDGPRELARGPHVYQARRGEGRVAVFWASAIDHRASPFTRQVLDP